MRITRREPCLVEGIKHNWTLFKVETNAEDTFVDANKCRTTVTGGRQYWRFQP